MDITALALVLTIASPWGVSIEIVPRSYWSKSLCESAGEMWAASNPLSRSFACVPTEPFGGWVGR